MSYLAQLLGSSGDEESSGGLLGFLNPTKMAYLGMIAKGLSPHSAIDPQAMLIQAQRLQAAREERKREERRHKELMDLRRDQFERLMGLDAQKLGIADRQRKATATALGALSGDTPAEPLPTSTAPQAVPGVKPKIAPYIQGGLTSDSVFTSPNSIAQLESSLSGGSAADSLLGGEGAGVPSPQQQILMERARSLEKHIRNPDIDDSARKILVDELNKTRARIGIPDDTKDPDTYRKKQTELDVARAEEERAKREARPQKQKELDITNAEIDKVIETSKNRGGVLPTTGFWGGQVLSNIGGTAARDTHTALVPVKSRISIDIMQKMKELSPQGASGFGQLAIKELQALENNLGTLDQTVSSPELFAENMERVRKNYNTLMGMTPTTMGTPGGAGKTSIRPGTYDWTPQGLKPAK